MCAIIDANASPDFVNNSAGAELILDWVEKRKGFIATGGQNLEELNKTKIGRLLSAFLRDGRARNYTEGYSLQEEVARYATDGRVTSDDSHILGLAAASGARVVFTNDQLLIEDFCNKDLINNPRGSVYKNKSHRHLLKKCEGCL